MGDRHAAAQMAESIAVMAVYQQPCAAFPTWHSFDVPRRIPLIFRTLTEVLTLVQI